MFVLTHHFEKRRQQRGIVLDQARTFLEHADIETPARNGCSQLRLSRATAASIDRSGKLAKLTAIVANSAAITAYRNPEQRIGWRRVSGCGRHRRRKPRSGADANR